MKSKPKEKQRFGNSLSIVTLPVSEYGKRPRAFTGTELFAERARKLVMRGYQPKDVAELVVQEIILEHRNDPEVLEQARADAEDFLRRVRQGLI